MINAATETIDGHEYAVMNVYSNTSYNETTSFMDENDYVKFILQEDFFCEEAQGSNAAWSEKAYFWRSTTPKNPGYVVLDLNGYSINPTAGVPAFAILGEYVTIDDSSPTQSGRINSNLYLFSRNNFDVHAYFYGGTFGTVNMHTSVFECEFFCEVFGGTIQYLTVLGDADLHLKIDGGTVAEIDPAITDVVSVVDGHEYAVFDVYGATTVNEIRTFYAGNANVKFVLREDWIYKPTTASNGDDGLWSKTSGLGGWVILELNGYSIDSAIPESVSKGYGMGILAENVKVMDSSSGGTGCIKGGLYLYNRVPGNLHLSVYGGKIDKIIAHLNTRTTDDGRVIVFDLYGGEIGGFEILRVPSNAQAALIDAASTKVKIYGGYLGSMDPEVTDIISVIDGVEYKTVYLTGDDTANREKIGAHISGDTGNYRYVMSADWDLIDSYIETEKNENNVLFYGSSIIFDLNGHKLTTFKYGDYNFGTLYFRPLGILEIADTSPTRTGCFAHDGYAATTFAFSGPHTVIISGGNCDSAVINVRDNKCKKIIIRGGNYRARNQALFNYYNNAKEDEMVIEFTPYLVTTFNGGTLLAFNTPDVFAVSASPFVTGLYNTEIGYVADLSLDDLLNLAVPADKTYYLWGRDTDGAYKYLNVVYRDGAWVTA